MRRISALGIFLTLAFSGSNVTAQDRSIEVTPLTEHLYLLSTDQEDYTTNTLAYVTDEGVLLVDTQAESDAPALKDAVEAFGQGTPKYIINTHRHAEHVGGNAIFGAAPIVIAHSLVPAKLKSGSYLFDEFAEATFPDITLTDSLTLYFAGERIRILALPGSHDDNEIIVHFTESKVVHLSSLVNGFNFPSVDGDGDALKFAELVGRAIELLPDDVRIVSGHNAVGEWADLHPYREMLVQTTAIVRDGLTEGKDLATLQAESALAEWDEYAGSYVSVDGWTEYLVGALQSPERPSRSVFEPLYAAWKDQGAEAAVNLYSTLKSDHVDEYRFPETTLLVIGMKLLNRDHTSAAVTFLKASLKEHPDSDYAYYAEYQLAEAHAKLGEREAALRHCEASLELKPGFGAATELRERLASR